MIHASVAAKAAAGLAILFLNVAPAGAQEKGSGSGGAAMVALSCEIVADVEPGKVTIRGRIGATAPVSGTYELSARRPGPNDTTAVQSRQANTFTITSSDPVTVGGITFGGAGKAAATMLVKTPDGGTSMCVKAIDVP